MNNCTCTPCKECGGTGHIWISFSGEYLGQHRRDDLAEMETCDECRGRGVDVICDYCLERDYEDG